jgi:hypothetical protein
MALNVTTANTVTMSDSTQNINIQQSKTVTDTTAGLNCVVQSYSIALGATSYIEIAKGDIASIQNIFLVVTHKPTVYAGLGLQLAASDPTTAAPLMTIKDTFVLANCSFADKIWIRNSNTDSVTILVILSGTNS